MGSKEKGKQVVSSNTSDDPTNTKPSADLSVMELCKEAWLIFNKIGNYNLALKIIEEACLLHKNSGLLHRVRGEICSLVPNDVYENYYSKAMESAKEATRLSPNSIMFSDFYFMKLFERDVQASVEEGERALAIQNPTDPATENFTDPDTDFKTPGERVGFLKRKIRDHVYQCKIVLGGVTDSSQLEEALQKKDKSDKALKKDLARKVPVKQIPDYPKWKMPQMVSVASDKDVLQSKVFIWETCREALRIFKTEERNSLPLKIIQEARFHNKNSALLHRAHGEICFLVSSQSDDCKDEYLFNARESEKEAVRLSPNSIEFAMHYARALFLSHHYKDAIEEGERALAIRGPIDPAEHYITDLATDLPDSEERIGLRRRLIMDIVELCRDILCESADNLAEVTSESYSMLIAKQKSTIEQAQKRMVTVELLLNYPNQKLGLSEKEQREKISALVAIGKIIMSFQEDSIVIPESQKIPHYWNSLSAEDKQNLLNLKTDDLFAHFNNKSTKKILSEAFAFYRDNKSWTFRWCFSCDKKFATAEEHLAHTVKEHVGSLSTEQKYYLPTELDERWDSVVRNGTWSPLEASAALQILEEKWELWPSIQEELRLNEDRVQWSMKYLLAETAPISNDSQRISALGNIQTLLKSLLENECLAAEHVKMVTEYSMNKLEVLRPGSRLRELCLDQTHLCICFLGLSELTEILELLEEISRIPNTTEKEKAIYKFPEANPPQTDISERIDLDGKSLCLLLDDSATANDDVEFKSIFKDSSREAELQKWAHLEIESKQKGKELQQILKKNVTSMKRWCDQKSDLLRSEKATEDLSLLLVSEFWARKQSSEHVPQSYEAILQKQREETGGSISEKDRKSRLDVLKQALSVDYKHEKSLAAVRTRICKLEIYEDADSEKPTPFQEDTTIKEAMKRTAKSIGLKLIKTDAKIKRTYKEYKKLEPQLNHLSGADYRTFLLPLVKSCILANLEKQANAAVEEEPQAATEENQAHVAPETNKSVNEEGDQSKKKQKSTEKKQNKKGKDSKESKSSKANQQVHTDRTEHSPSHHVEPTSHLELENTGAVTDVDLKKEEERLQWEKEERMLIEKLENQRQIEDSYQQNRPVQEHTEVAVPPQDEMVIDVSPQEDPPDITTTTTVNTPGTSNLSDVGEQTQTTSATAGAPINTVPSPIDETEAATTRCQMGTEVAQEEVIPQLTATTTENTRSTDVGLGQPTQATAGASIDNVPSAIDETEAATSRCQMVSEVAQREDIPLLSATTTENTSSTNVELGQQTQTTAAPIDNVPIARHQAEGSTSSSSDLVPDDPLKHPALSGVIGLQGCSGGAASMLLSLRFKAAMDSYNDPSTEPSERPVMYSEPEVDFFAELQQAIRLSKENPKPSTEDKQDSA